MRFLTIICRTQQARTTHYNRSWEVARLDPKQQVRDMYGYVIMCNDSGKNRSSGTALKGVSCLWFSRICHFACVLDRAAGTGAWTCTSQAAQGRYASGWFVHTRCMFLGTMVAATVVRSILVTKDKGLQEYLGEAHHF